ncbi:MAG: DUF3160 domain-containing protein [Chloroflexi bacterium]|nr:DUF3160 domain-containing protein [Chloroflexota bacterium]
MRPLVISLLLLSLLVPIPHMYAQEACGDAPTPRVDVGATAYVTFTDGTPLNIRSAPGTSAERIDQLPEGSSFTVGDGPTCADGYYWWQIDYGDGKQGWVAEGDAEEYFIAPGTPMGSDGAIDLDGFKDAADNGLCPDVSSRFSEGDFVELVPGVTFTYSNYSGGIDEIGSNEWFHFFHGPICVSGAILWEAEGAYYGVIPEFLNGVYLLEPFEFVPAEPVALGITADAPVITEPVLPVPTVIPDERLVASEFAGVWTFTGAPDPLLIEMPDTYSGDFPSLPVNLDEVRFVADAGLSDAQLRALAQNGFVVVPGDASYFDDAYFEGWDHAEGKADFITTDAVLDTLYQLYENTLKYLEMDQLYGQVSGIVASSLVSARQQWEAVAGTVLEEPARRAVIYYAVAALALEQGASDYTGSYPPLTSIGEALASLDSDTRAESEAVYAMIAAEEGSGKVPILTDYTEDFSQYKPRSYYPSTKALSSYFRAMMWLGRITFRTKDRIDTQTGLLAVRALAQSGAYGRWATLDETLAWLVGPVDDLSPDDALPLMRSIYGDDLPLGAMADDTLTDQVIAGLLALPGPKINSIELPVGIKEDELDAFSRGIRVFGQRFTFDGYVMQNLIYPAVGERQQSRALPMVEDVAAVLGSDLAFVVTDAAGATDFLHYTENLDELRQEVNTITAEAWQETLYGAWLSALQPLLVRDDALYPPLMQTDAWKYKDINTFAGSYTQLKHATLLYAEQPYGGLGGGGWLPPVTSYSVVEPNPLVFARIAIAAHSLVSGLEARGYFENAQLLSAVRFSATDIESLAAVLADLAVRELRGEPFTSEEYYNLQEHFAQRLSAIRMILQEAIVDPPERMALIADIASNPSAKQILYTAVGNVDTLWVVTNSPYGLQLTRGFVYSSYQFTGDIQSRLTDDDWRARVEAGDLPPRPSWSSTYLVP